MKSLIDFAVDDALDKLSPDDRERALAVPDGISRTYLLYCATFHLDPPVMPEHLIPFLEAIDLALEEMQTGGAHLHSTLATRATMALVNLSSSWREDGPFPTIAVQITEAAAACAQHPSKYVRAFAAEVLEDCERSGPPLCEAASKTLAALRADEYVARYLQRPRRRRSYEPQP